MKDRVEAYASVLGRAQGVAFVYGQGRLVVLTPTALLTAAYLARPDMDHRQLVLNLMDWLSGLTEP